MNKIIRFLENSIGMVTSIEFFVMLLIAQKYATSIGLAEIKLGYMNAFLLLGIFTTGAIIFGINHTIVEIIKNKYMREPVEMTEEEMTEEILLRR